MGINGLGRTLVTGAASGIGFAIAERVVAAGGELVMTDRDIVQLTAARQRMAASTASINLIAGDLTNAADVEKVFAAVGRIDGLVNCAGIYPVTPLLELSVEEWDRVIAINLRAPFLVTQAVARSMIKEGIHGSIVNISSTASTLARPGIAHYGASKAGLNQLTRVLAVELAPNNIRVNAILPGVIGTERVTSSVTTTAGRAEMDAKVARIPLQRLGTPEEVADLAVFLLSVASSYSTGGLFTVDGGFSLGMARY
ncbi:MAG: SDR family NAD(P)-dependent oxidoreductase [Hyphomicrobiaceae bacterium]